MKILDANEGVLTNFEVLDFLRSKGAAKDSTRVLAKVTPSEYKVYDYLVETAACNQTKENINDFLEKCKKFDLVKADLLNIINIRPSFPVVLFSTIEDCEERFEEVKELLALVTKTLPLPPNLPNSEEEIIEGKEEIENGEQHKVESTGEEQNKQGIDDGKEETVAGEQMETS
ncbi:dna-directed rna polymerase iii subunit rpc9 [Fagus crenata]